MKLLFNPSTKSIVLYNKGKYYDMRNGNETVIKGKLPTMHPYDRYTLSKPEAIKPRTFPFANTTIVDGKYQFGGNFPRYFWKGLVKLIKNNTI